MLLGSLVRANWELQGSGSGFQVWTLAWRAMLVRGEATKQYPGKLD